MKLKTLTEICRIVKPIRLHSFGRWVTVRKKIVFTNGCFDLLHVGHIRCLQAAKSFGDILIVGLNSDKSVRRIKGKDRPFVCQEERAEMLSALDCVDYVVLFDEKSPLQLIRKIRPDIHVKGGDWSADRLPETSVVEQYGGVVKIVPLVEGKSTSALARQIVEQVKEDKDE